MQCWSPEVSWSDDERVRYTYPGHQEELVDEIWAWMEGIVELCLSPGSARGGGVKRIDWGKKIESLTRTRMAKLHPAHINSHGHN